MVSHQLRAFVTSISLVGAELPTLSATERAHLQAGPRTEARTPDPTSKQSTQVETAIEQYRDAIREIYLANGQRDTLISHQIVAFERAAQRLAESLDPSFTPSTFTARTLIDKINYLAEVLLRHDYILGNFDVTADMRDGSRAILSANLDKVVAATTIASGHLDFSLIGLSRNPLPDKLPFYESLSVIAEARGTPMPAPLSALALDLKKKTFGLALGRNGIAQCLPGYDTARADALTPGSRAFLTDWALGRLAYHLGCEASLCSLPRELDLGGRGVPLRSLMGIAYALDRNSNYSPELATLIRNQISLTASSPDSALLAVSSQLVCKHLATLYPEIGTLESCEAVHAFFQREPNAAKKYLTSLRDIILKQLEELKKNISPRPRNQFSI
jgi:hypothetical protein